MIDKINILILKSRKNKDIFRTTCLNMVKAELINNSKAKKPLKDLQIILSYLKRLEKSINAFKDTFKFTQLKEEIKIIKELVPKTLPEDKIEAVVKEYFSFANDKVTPGIAIKNLKENFGEQNSPLIVKHVMRYWKK